MSRIGLRALLKDGPAIYQAFTGIACSVGEGRALIDAAARLADHWPGLPPTERRAMLQSLIQEITIRSQTINLEVRLATLPVILESRSAGAGTANSCGGRIRVKAPVDVPSVRVSIPAELKRTGQETRLLVHWALDIEARKPDRSLLRLLGQARQFGMMVMDGQGRSVRKLAAEAGVSPSYFTRLFRLQFLAPEIVQAILPGEQPPGLTANRLKLAGTLACAWSEQRRQLGFD